MYRKPFLWDLTSDVGEERRGAKGEIKGTATGRGGVTGRGPRAMGINLGKEFFGDRKKRNPG